MPKVTDKNISLETSEAARKLQCSIPTIKKLIEQKKIRAIKLASGRFLFSERNLEEFLESLEK